MFTVKLKEDQISVALERLARAVSDMSPVMNSIGEQLEFTTVRRFDEGVSPEGAPWAPKSQTTLDAYARRGLAGRFSPALWSGCLLIPIILSGHLLCVTSPGSLARHLR